MFDKVVGQKSIVRELKALSTYVRHHINERPGYAILFTGTGGFGKTYLARELCKSLGIRYTYQIPSNGYIYLDETSTLLYPHIIDEIHLAKNQEMLYPLIDSKKHLFVMCTTDPGLLNEPLLTRVITHRLEEYSIENLVDIIMLHATEALPIERSSAKIIAERCRGNPRVAITYTKRVILLIYNGHYPNSMLGVDKACEDIGIYHKGYTDDDYKYINVLAKMGEANLTVLSSVLKIDKLTIRQDIEPFLVENGHVVITPRGRKFVKGIDND